MDLRDRIIEAMEQALEEWDYGVQWVDTVRLVSNEADYPPRIEVDVRYAPGEFAYKFGDRVAALLDGVGDPEEVDEPREHQTCWAHDERGQVVQVECGPDLPDERPGDQIPLEHASPLQHERQRHIPHDVEQRPLQQCPAPAITPPPEERDAPDPRQQEDEQGKPGEIVGEHAGLQRASWAGNARDCRMVPQSQCSVGRLYVLWVLNAPWPVNAPWGVLIWRLRCSCVMRVGRGVRPVPCLVRAAVL